MVLIDELNYVSAIKTVSIGDLNTNTRYLMKDVRSVPTRFGKGVAATLFDPRINKDVDIYLPHRISAILSDDYIQEINCGQPMYLIYLGKIGQSYNVKFEY